MVAGRRNATAGSVSRSTLAPRTLQVLSDIPRTRRETSEKADEMTIPLGWFATIRWRLRTEIRSHGRIAPTPRRPAIARASKHHLGRWPRYFRRASQCHVAIQERTVGPVHPEDRSAHDEARGPRFSSMDQRIDGRRAGGPGDKFRKPPTWPAIIFNDAYRRAETTLRLWTIKASHLGRPDRHTPAE